VRWLGEEGQPAKNSRRFGVSLFSQKNQTRLKKPLGGGFATKTHTGKGWSPSRCGTDGAGLDSGREGSNETLGGKKEGRLTMLWELGLTGGRLRRRNKFQAVAVWGFKWGGGDPPSCKLRRGVGAGRRIRSLAIRGQKEGWTRFFFRVRSSGFEMGGGDRGWGKTTQTKTGIAGNNGIVKRGGPGKGKNTHPKCGGKISAGVKKPHPVTGEKEGGWGLRDEEWGGKKKLRKKSWYSNDRVSTICHNSNPRT